MTSSYSDFSLGLHRVLEDLRPAADKRPLQELLRLTAQRALHHGLDAAAQLIILTLDQQPVVALAEQVAEGAQVAEQRSGGLDILHQAPEFGEIVLDRRRGQQQHGLWRRNPRMRSAIRASVESVW